EGPAQVELGLRVLGLARQAGSVSLCGGLEFAARIKGVPQLPLVARIVGCDLQGLAGLGQRRVEVAVGAQSRRQAVVEAGAIGTQAYFFCVFLDEARDVARRL